MNQDTRQRLIRAGVVTGVLLLLYALFRSTVGLYTDWLWFSSLGKQQVLQTRLAAQVTLWLVGGLVVTLWLVVNWFIIPRRMLAQLRLDVRGRRHLTIGARVLAIVLQVLTAFVTVLMASEASNRWMTFLTFRHSVPFGASDPIFGLDASFYVFQLPLYRFLTVWVMVLIAATAIGNGVISGLAGRIRDRWALVHLATLGRAFLSVLAVDYQLQRFALLNTDWGAVYGAGYTDIHARLPALTVLTVAAVVCAAALLLGALTRRWRLPLYGAGAWLAVALLSPVYASAVQTYTVQPNELALEQPYIEHNIRLTRYAYGLAREDGTSLINESDYPVSGTLTVEQLEENGDILNNVRLWDWKPLLTTYEQLQEIRTYYTFAEVDLDRYVIDGHLRQVTLAVRELDIEQMQDKARTWINDHLIYTHGYGLCLSSVAEVSEEGLPVFLVGDIPPQSIHPTLAIDRPEIYFGEKTAHYVIVNTDEEEFDYPSDENAYVRYSGPAGVALSNLFRRLAFATRFESTPIVFSNAIRPDSRILFHRTLHDRAATLAPMLWYDKDPYPVIVDGRIVWLYDAYTWTDRFPYSTPELDIESVWGLDYIRNSVKVSIDAYTGETTFYVVDPSDPLIQTYRAIFPDLFTSGDEMEESLRAHWRYPEQLFLIQADIYAAYHMKDPRVFYNKEDLWATPKEMREAGEIPVDVEPYYVVMRLPGDEAAEFMMIRPYVPANKQNMIAWLYADSDGEDYGQLGVYKFSKEKVIYGPQQIEGRIEQDPYISQQLTLWKRGSSIIRGNLIIIPLDGTLLYIEPLYLQSESGQLPEFKRVLLAHGNRIAMANDLATGLTQVLSEEPASGEELPAGDVGTLARSAQTHYEAAQECLRNGDWECYGREMEAMEADLEALVKATEE